MDGLYATLDALRHKMHLCQFPFGTTACQNELARLRQVDPAAITDVVPADPIDTIAPQNQLDAYHFLMRAASAIINDDPDDAIPYLMAFSTLSAVRFACIELASDQAGINIIMTVMDEINPSEAKQAILAMFLPLGTMH